MVEKALKGIYVRRWTPKNFERLSVHLLNNSIIYGEDNSMVEYDMGF